MTISNLLPVTEDALPAILALNNEHARELSWLEPERLAHLVAQAFWSVRVGNGDAFLLGFDENADYTSANFLWFKERYPRFAYVDRVVVAKHARGRGLARRLYEEFFRQAADAGHTMVACEVNMDPPNPESDAFHAAMGFEEAGSAEIYGGERTVRYLVKALGA